MGRSGLLLLMATTTAPAVVQGQRPDTAAAFSTQYDTSAYADDATYRLVELARARHAYHTAALRSYRASVYTRVEGRIGPSRFAPGLTLFDYETAAAVRWEAPGNTQVNVMGARAAAPRFPLVNRDDMGGYWAELLAGEPWFIPAALGDDIQLMGIPDEEALHPLAAGADRFYRYRIVDSLRIGLPDRTVRAVSIAVQPRDYRLVAPRASSRRRRSPRVPTLVDGEMWVDADSLDVVRLTVTFLGPDIWDDDPEAPQLVALEADLEYGLHVNRFWLPYRQILAAKFVYRLLPGATLPATAVTTFSDYDVNVIDSLVFATPPSAFTTGWRDGARWRCEPWGWERDHGGRCGSGGFITHGTNADGTVWEVIVPHWDSLQRFDFGTDSEHAVSLASEQLVDERLGQLAALTEAVPAQVRRDHTMVPIDWSAALRIFRFNRVQGPSVGTTARVPLPMRYTSGAATARLGIGDERLTGRIQLTREGPGGRLDMEAYREVRDVDPWTSGTSVGNSFKALFSGHDDADYLLAQGSRIRWSGYHAPWAGVAIEIAYQRERPMAQVAGSFVNDVFFGSGRFAPNPAATPGDYLRLRLVRTQNVGPLEVVFGAEGARSAARQAGRVWGTVTAPFTSGRMLGAVRIRGGATAGDRLTQLMWRAGGPPTVRGYDYGARVGTRVWAVQAEAEREIDTWWGPFVFVDVGNVDRFRDPLVGLGGGISLLSGWVRIQLAKGVRPNTNVRGDVLVQIPIN